MFPFIENLFQSFYFNFFQKLLNISNYFYCFVPSINTNESPRLAKSAPLADEATVEPRNHDPPQTANSETIHANILWH